VTDPELTLFLLFNNHPLKKQILFWLFVDLLLLILIIQLIPNNLKP